MSNLFKLEEEGSNILEELKYTLSFKNETRKAELAEGIQRIWSYSLPKDDNQVPKYLKIMNKQLKKCVALSETDGDQRFRDKLENVRGLVCGLIDESGDIDRFELCAVSQRLRVAMARIISMDGVPNRLLSRYGVDGKKAKKKKKRVKDRFESEA